MPQGLSFALLSALRQKKLGTRSFGIASAFAFAATLSQLSQTSPMSQLGSSSSVQLRGTTRLIASKSNDANDDDRYCKSKSLLATYRNFGAAWPARACVDRSVGSVSVTESSTTPVGK